MDGILVTNIDITVKKGHHSKCVLHHYQNHVWSRAKHIGLECPQKWTSQLKKLKHKVFFEDGMVLTSLTPQ
jgi:hypothetical protein